MTTPDPSRAAFEQWYSTAGENSRSVERQEDGRYIYVPTEVCWVAWQAAMAHKGAELEQAHDARRQAQTQLADIQELRNRIGLDIDRALRGAVNEQSPIAGRLKLIAQKAGQWKPWPMG